MIKNGIRTRKSSYHSETLLTAQKLRGAATSPECGVGAMRAMSRLWCRSTAASEEPHSVPKVHRAPQSSQQGAEEGEGKADPGTFEYD